jgi:hypothetical protein
MKVSKVIAKIEKRLGQKGIVTRQGSKFYIQHGGYVASFYGSFDGLSGGGINDDKSTAELDASLDNATQMIDWIDPPGSKFKVGQLVRAKNNKRMDRYRLAGNTGIVTNTANKSCKVEWTTHARNYGYIADRDLELLSAG